MLNKLINGLLIASCTLFLLTLISGDAHSAELNPGIISMLQKQYNGRVVSITPSPNCRMVSQEVVIGNRKTTADNNLCRDQSGNWSLKDVVDVQILTQGNNIIIISVDPASGSIVAVKE